MTALVVTAWLTVGAFAFIRYRYVFREVVLRRPVLAFESDDWGPGPAEDGMRLRELAACAAHYRDSRNRPLTVTLGVVLAVAETPVRVSHVTTWCGRLTLADERCAAVRDAMLDGAARGVFALQLHCAEHYWPPALCAAATRDNSVDRWLSSPGIPRTESLPAHLQSRWIDASVLPSRPLADAAISLAVDDEVSLFESVFGKTPDVVVPPTFVWDERVERAWATRGIRVVITSGCRREGRDATGRLEVPTRKVCNGERSLDTGALYLVRDVYFEPALGHRAEGVLARVVQKARLGQPALIEMHRFNYVDDLGKARTSLAEFRRLLELTLDLLPNVRFVAPGELAEAIERGDPDLVDTRFLGRLAVWLRRLWEVRRLKWLAVGTAAIVPAAMVWFAASFLTGRLRLGIKV